MKGCIMRNKVDFGRMCEDLVAKRIRKISGYVVKNLNDERPNHPITDLKVTKPKTKESYEVSVKAKERKSWPAVKGIQNVNQYIIFVDYLNNESPIFYILNYREWNVVLKKILPTRETGAMIVNGALEWNWIKGGKPKKFRGSMLFPEEIKKYRNQWHKLPGIKANRY